MNNVMNTAEPDEHVSKRMLADMSTRQEFDGLPMVVPISPIRKSQEFSSNVVSMP